jgi:hypothetical protein
MSITPQSGWMFSDNLGSPLSSKAGLHNPTLQEAQSTQANRGPQAFPSACKQEIEEESKGPTPREVMPSWADRPVPIAWNVLLLSSIPGFFFPLRSFAWQRRYGTIRMAVIRHTVARSDFLLRLQSTQAEASLGTFTCANGSGYSGHCRILLHRICTSQSGQTLPYIHSNLSNS